MNSFNWDLRNLTVQTHSGLRWSDIKRQLTDWRHLEGLDERCLQDIGISSGTLKPPRVTIGFEKGGPATGPLTEIEAHRGWPNLAAAGCPSISAATCLAASQCSSR
jgi:hypothetical protein